MVRFPWDDEDQRAQPEQRARSRAGRRGIGAALHREIPRDPGEPFLGVFIVSDGSRSADVLVQCAGWPMLCETAVSLEKAVEDRLLATACRGSSCPIGNLRAVGGSVMVLRPVPLRPV
jgi:hypothetical protein